MSRSTDGRPGQRHLPLHRPCHLVARRELVDEPLAAGVEQPGAFAAYRLGDEEPVRAVGADDGGGVELHELEVGERRARRERQQQSAADRDDRVGGARPQRGGAAGGEHDAAAPDRASVVEAHAGAAIPRDENLNARRPSSTSIAGSSATTARQLSDQPPPGRRAAGVHDPARRVTALEPERQAAGAIGVEPNAEPGQVADRVGRLLAQHARGRLAHRTAPRDDRVAQVAARGCPPPRRRRPAHPAPTSSMIRPAASPRPASRAAPSRAARRAV